MTIVEVESAGRSARDVLDAARRLVDPALRAAVDTLPASMAQMAGYHFGWLDELGRPAHTSGGKAIRPALVLAAAEAVGGTVDDATAGAAAVELVHNFSLVHDDVMDGDATRRHRATVWKVFGRNAAILAGDALLTLALEVLAGFDHSAMRRAMRLTNATVLELLEGQSQDTAFEHRSNVDIADCLAMAEKKTAALLGCSCAVGATYGGGGPAQVERITRFGRRLGLAFQHVDDLLGIWGDPAATGKPVFSDLRNRKKSLPVVAAMSAGTPAAVELSQLYGRKAGLSDAELAHAAELVEAAGGRAWSQHQAEALLAEALDELEAAGPTAGGAAELTALARLVIQRDH
ncbi:family 2 encapsulin nanocompartment cargo protein polyprenyl transferase [Fodinicola acaciae]|uniref:family 2 encapsulin nanocompartment cargo protein polyprenyl transferase n=1 Tax=Fodinicola acaciae TaxID=2681555 RepID=UPI0013D7B657|nr:family 2 encapsulin nanocompartment cargo protein polyprenyl transferase [Fodinicola acaciae]